MSTQESVFLERWRRERSAYELWGSYVAERLTASIATAVNPVSFEKFIQIPIKPRVKEEPSLVAKAFHRDKSYDNPFVQIEDKVGLRIVVLSSNDISFVEQIICSDETWDAVKARDFELERQKNPYEFAYQSVHYIVRSKTGVAFNGALVTPDLPCESQIRTMLQHAYSELTYDVLYKPSVQADPEVKRSAAKSMALIEATDDYFQQVRQHLLRAEKSSNEILDILTSTYERFVHAKPEQSPLDQIVIDHVKKWIADTFSDDLVGFLTEKSFISQNVRLRRPHELIYRQASVLLLYWAARYHPRELPVDGPFSNADLAEIYADLGLHQPKKLN